MNKEIPKENSLATQPIQTALDMYGMFKIIEEGYKEVYWKERERVRLIKCTHFSNQSSETSKH